MKVPLAGLRAAPLLLAKRIVTVFAALTQAIKVPSAGTDAGSTPNTTASPATAPVNTVPNTTSVLEFAGVSLKSTTSEPVRPEIKVPVVGKVTFVAPVAVKVVENAPDVARVLPFAKVNVAGPPGLVIATLFILVAAAAPRVGVTKVGDVE